MKIIIVKQLVYLEITLKFKKLKIIYLKII